MNEKYTIVLTNREIQLAAFAIEALGDSPLFNQKELQELADKIRKQFLDKKQEEINRRYIKENTEQ